MTKKKNNEDSNFDDCVYENDFEVKEDTLLQTLKYWLEDSACDINFEILGIKWNLVIPNWGAILGILSVIVCLFGALSIC